MTKSAWIAALVLLLAACGGSPSIAQATPTPAKQSLGPLGDTWTWDGGAWHRATGNAPSPRYAAALAYDAQRNVYVLFGGQTAKGATDETWTWDGTTWKAQSPAHKPRARTSAALAYDPTRHIVVLYGGLIAGPGEGAPGGDTWTWDGSDWTQVDEGPGAPGGRDGPRMVTAGNRVLLFGGRNFNVNYYGDAWTWDGKAWTRVDKEPRPPGRSNTALTWIASESSLFIYGGTGFNASAGIGANGQPLGDAWSWSSGAWKELKGSGPPALAQAGAMWDGAKKSAIVMLGMLCPKPSDASWAWDETAWSKLGNPGISARWGAALAQDKDGKALLFGGSNEAGC